MKILYVTTVSDTMGFFTSHIKMLLEEGHTVDMTCNIDKPINQELIDLGCNAYNIEFSRSPSSPSNIKAYKKLRKLIMEKEYDIVHTHTPVASVCVRLACKKLNNVRVIYTAHGFHFFKGAAIKNWLVFYPIERLLSRYTDVLITINKEDYNIAIKKFNTKKVEYIPGVGLNTKKINELIVDKSMKRKEMGIPNDAIILLSVGELNKNKNHETVIKALAKIERSNIYYIICGRGPLEQHLQDLIVKLNVDKNVQLLGFRTDILEICKAVDIFIFPSYREGLPVSIMEAMACELPVICSDIRGNTDLVANGKGGYTVKSGNIDEYVSCITILIDDPQEREYFGKVNKADIVKFSNENVLNELLKIYQKVKLY
ncbi:glycosyltransferase family 4 protein [Sporosarcina sp. BP05]|uniref:glycosyltransferase family 4 protein n=1 Tax=Sporosarcina sp. BP05 TaxID=2758726 RepID=UPI0016440B5B|nr:glycosyltransferase family 4 protein [Sporosarcina sp. BP05]